MNKNMNNKPIFDRRGKSGTYAVVLSLILLAVLIMVNVIVSTFPGKYTLIDTSSTGKYDISGTSENFISKLGERVTIYYVSTSQNKDTAFEAFVDRYASMSRNITVVDVDPIDNPSFVEKYQAADLSENSLIIESDKRVKIIDYYDFFLFTNSDIGYTMSYEEYAQYGQMYEQYYGYTFTPVQYYDSVMTLGIEYVTAEKVPSMYLLEGHGEAEFADVVKDNLDYVGVTYTSLNLALGDPIPDDCTCLVINAPASDITAREASTIKEYLDNGGSVFLFTQKNSAGFSNLMSVASVYGLSAEGGTVNEGDSGSHISSEPAYIYPVVNDSHEAVSYIVSNDIPLLVTNAHAINAAEVSGVEVSALLTTSEKAYSVSDNVKGESGVKNLGVMAQTDTGKFCWISSGEFISDSMIYYTNGGNFYAFYSMTNYLTGNYSSSLPEIPGVELSEPLIVTTATDANVWGTILIFIVPLSVIGAGIGYSVYRRRR